MKNLHILFHKIRKLLLSLHIGNNKKTNNNPNLNLKENENQNFSMHVSCVSPGTDRM